MSQLTRTTITLPEDTLKLLKLRAIIEKKSVSSILVESAEYYISKERVRRKRKPSQNLLGGFRLGINKLYDERDELYSKT